MAEGNQEQGLRASGARVLLVLPLALLVFALLVAPLGLLFVQSLRPGAGILDAPRSAAGLTLENYRALVQDTEYRGALLHSVALSLGIAAVSTLLCLPPAWLLARRAFLGVKLVRAVLTLPMSFSGIIVGFLTVIMLGRIGFVPRLLERLTGHDLLSGLSYKVFGIVLAYVYFEIPRATLTLEAALRGFDTRLDAAAKTLGAGFWRRFFLVFLPLTAPALLSTFAVTFSVSLGSFGVALIVSKRFSLLSLEIFQQYTGMLNGPLAAAMAFALGSLALTVNLAMRLSLERRARA